MAEKKSTATAKKVATKKVVESEKKVVQKKGIVINKKLANPESILIAYDQLINQLAKAEAAQRLKNKPYRIYFVHRKRAEVMRLNFVKSMR